VARVALPLADPERSGSACSGWSCAASSVVLTLGLGIIVVWLPLGVVTIWLRLPHRRGWIRLAARQPMYAEPPLVLTGSPPTYGPSYPYPSLSPGSS